MKQEIKFVKDECKSTIRSIKTKSLTLAEARTITGSCNTYLRALSLELKLKTK